jgi:hypothetical protein
MLLVLIPGRRSAESHYSDSGKPQSADPQTASQPQEENLVLGRLA